MRAGHAAGRALPSAPKNIFDSAMAYACNDRHILRCSRQIVLKAMDQVRTSMRGLNRLPMGNVVENSGVEKAALNPTKAIDRDTEDLVIAALGKKFSEIADLGPYTIFSEEAGIQTFPEGSREADARWVVFVDPIDGTEFAEALQGGWCLLGIYDRLEDEVAVVVAGDIFLDRLFWASRSGDAEALDFITHSWFRLDGGPNPKPSLAGARVNLLTTKVSRYLAVAQQRALLEAIEENDGRINLAWGSNLIIQVAAGYADVGLEFAKGFATYDILPGLFIAEKAGLTVLDLQGNRLSSRLKIDEIFQTYRDNPKKPQRTPFVVAKKSELANQVVELLRL